MTDLYKKYFNDVTLSEGILDLCHDISNGEISYEELCGLLDLLVKQNKIQRDSNIKVKSENEWDKQYVNHILNGIALGDISADYIKHLYLVCNKLRNKKIVSSIYKIIIAVFMLILIILLFLRL